MQLYLLRHAESVNNAAPGPEHWVTDPELTKTGIQQAALAAVYLDHGAPNMLGPEIGFPITHVIGSPMMRNLQTLEPIANALNLGPEIWPEVAENISHRAPWNGRFMMRQEIAARFPGYILHETITETSWWPNGKIETLDECHARGQRVAVQLSEMARNNPHEAVLIVSHGEFMNSLVHAILGLQPGVYRYSHSNTGLTRIDYQANGQAYLRYTNRIDHLPGRLVTPQR